MSSFWYPRFIASKLPAVPAADYASIWGDVPHVPQELQTMNTNHPNRNPNSVTARPAAEAIHAERLRYGLTVEQAAALIYERPSRWHRMELGEAPMHPASWELFQIKAPRV